MRKLLRRMGVYAGRRAVAPVGVDLQSDLTRLGIRPKWIFDVGANRGQTAREFHALWPDARIFSFEPFAGAFGYLQRLAKDIPELRPVQMACGSSTGTVEVSEEAGSEENSLVSALAVGSGKATINVTTIDDYCRRTAGWLPIDLLKTDTEGYELEVIAGAKGMLGDGMVRSMLVETCFDRADKRHVHFCDILAALEPHGFRVVGFYDGRLNAKGWHFGNVLFFHH